MNNILLEIQKDAGRYLANVVDNAMLRRALQSSEESMLEDYKHYLMYPEQYQLARIGHVRCNTWTFDEFKNADLQFRNND